jgi:hydrogenase nickel incorporation protein HypA/HybF
MHELAITKGILSVAVEAAEQAGGHRITSIDMVIGELSSIVDDSVQFYFDILSKETIADGAALHFRREPAIATCMDCSHKFEIRAPIEPVCPQCGGILLQIQDGNEFFVESIEVENENSSS